MAGQATAYDPETGEPISDEEAHRAVASGKGAFKKGSKVFVADPDTGATKVVDSSQAGTAVQSGYYLLSDSEVQDRAERIREREEAESLGGLTRTAAEGAARGVSFGASDWALKESGLADPEKMKLRQEVNPMTSTGSEIVGAVAPIVATGGAGAAGTAARGAGALARTGAAARTAARYAPTSLLSRGAGRVAGKIAAKGAGRGTAARVGAKAAGEATAGAIEGAAYGAGQQISEAALQDKELTAEMLLEGATDGALFGGFVGGGVGALGAGAKAAGRKIKDRVGGLKDVAETSAFRQMSGTGARVYNKAKTQARRQRVGRRLLDDEIPLNNLDEAVDATKRKMTEAGEEISDVARKMDDAGRKIERSQIMSNIRTRADELASSGLKSDKKLGKKLVREFDELGEGDIAFSDAWSVKRRLGKKAFPQKGTDPTEFQQELQRVYWDLSDAMEGAVRSDGDDLARAWKEANTRYSDYKLANEGFSANQSARERTSGVASVPDSIMGASGGGLGLAYSVATGATGPGAILPMLAGAGLGAANKKFRQEGAGWIAKVADRMSKSNASMDHAARKLVGSSRLPSPSKRTAVPIASTLGGQYERITDDIKSMKQPEILTRRLQHVTGPIADTHPDVAMAMQQRMMNDAQYLQAQVPKGGMYDATTTITPKAEKKQLPDRTSMMKFVSKAKALNDPVSVIEDIAEGDIDLAAIEALKDRRPKIWTKMRERIMQHAAEKEEEIPYDQKVALSLAFDFTADPSMDPQMMGSIQSSFQPIEQEGPGRPRKMESDQPQQLQTPSQKATITG